MFEIRLDQEEKKETTEEKEEERKNKEEQVEDGTIKRSFCLLLVIFSL